MTAHVLTLRRTEFVLWRPARTDPVPLLVIGRLQPGAPVTLVGERSVPLAPSPHGADLWTVPAARCGLEDGQVWHYWFEVTDAHPGRSGQRVRVTDPWATTVDWRLRAPQPPGPGYTAADRYPASVVRWRDGVLEPCDPGGEYGELDDVPAASLPPNNRIVLYELPTAWSAGSGEGRYERGVGTFRDVAALVDRAAGGADFAALDVTMRRVGGCPTYLLTDNEKTVTVEHVAGIPVRNEHMLAWSKHYGITVHTCEPADPASKGGSESTVKIAKADLVPTEVNLREQYATFGEFEAAWELFCEQVNNRPHRVTRRRPVDMLAEERPRLHRIPDDPHTVAFGVARSVSVKSAMVAFDHCEYSVPDTLLGQQVWVRAHGVGDAERIVIVHVGPGGPVEVARHRRATPGTPAVEDDHFRDPAPAGALHRQPRAKSQLERDFLDLGDGARLWLTEAAAAGTQRMRVKMAAAVATAKLVGGADVDRALGHAALNGRFGANDLASILEHQALTQTGPVHRAAESRSLTQGTSGWAALGRPSVASTSLPCDADTDADTDDEQGVQQ